MVKAQLRETASASHQAPRRACSAQSPRPRRTKEQKRTTSIQGLIAATIGATYRSQGRNYGTNTRPTRNAVDKAGEIEVLGGEQEEIDSYFETKRFRFHGPEGFEADYAGLTEYFQSIRAAFDDRSIRRGITLPKITTSPARRGWRQLCSGIHTFTGGRPTS
jgi:hypothetical protein